MTNTILLTRPLQESLETASKVKELGLNVLIAPMMDIAGNDKPLIDLSPFDALIFTSAHGVRIFKDKSPQRNFKVYCVGDKTAQTAEEAGFADVTSASGKAENLFQLLVRERGRHKYLYLRADHVAYPMAKALMAEGISCAEHVLYETIEANALPEHVLTALDSGAIGSVAFYSKRTAEIFMKLVAHSGRTSALKSIKALCLSDNVIESANVTLWKSTSVSVHPDAPSMLALIEEDSHRS